MKVNAHCDYCDHSWEEILFRSSDRLECPTCGDRRIKVSDPHKSAKIDYYAGSAPFPNAPVNPDDESDGIF